MKKRKADRLVPDGHSMLGLQNVAHDQASHIYNLGLKAAGAKPEEFITRKDWQASFHGAIDQTFWVKSFLQPAAEGNQPVTIYIANIQKLLQTVLDEVPWYKEAVENLLEADPHRCFSFLCYHDECTAGNILQPRSGKKASFFYFAIEEVGRLHRETSFHPICMMQHNTVSLVKGGFSRVFLAIVESIRHERFDMGVPLRFKSGNKLFFARIRHWIGDLDALRQSLDAKGSAGMRVCVKCKNVLKRDSGVPKVDPYFVEVSSSNIEKFDLQTDSDIFSVYDNLLEQQEVLNKTKLGKLEVATGFVANCHGFLASKEARLYCPPSCWLLDVMHLYYSNGCASWEVVLLVEQIQTHGISLRLLQESFETTDWKRKQGAKNTPSWRKNLVHECMFSGDSYRGSAEDLKALLPLLYFHVEETLGRAGHLKSELKSFTLLLQIHHELDRLTRSKPMNTDLLKKLQVEHQHAFCTCYGQDKMKPKHHQRLHLADQMASQQIYVDCFPCEKKHRAYKTYVGTGRFDMFASGVRNEQSQFCKMNLENMFLYHIHSLQTTSNDTALQKPIQQQGLNSYMATKATFRGKAIAVGDMFLAPTPGCIKSLSSNNAGSVTITLEKVQLLSKKIGSSTWKKTSDEIVVNILGSSPSFWSWDNNECLCLH